MGCFAPPPPPNPLLLLRLLGRGGLLLPLFADAHSSDDVIAFEGITQS